MTILVEVEIHRKEPMSLVASGVCMHEEGHLLFLTRVNVHPYVICELESSPEVLRELDDTCSRSFSHVGELLA